MGHIFTWNTLSVTIFERNISHCRNLWDRNLCLQSFSESQANSKKSKIISIERGQEIIYKVWEKIFPYGKIILQFSMMMLIAYLWNPFLKGVQFVSLLWKLHGINHCSRVMYIPFPRFESLLWRRQWLGGRQLYMYFSSVHSYPFFFWSFWDIF